MVLVTKNNILSSDTLAVITGPCLIENREQMIEVANGVKKYGAVMTISFLTF